MRTLVIVAAALLVVVPAFAETVRVECRGDAVWNQVYSGPLAAVAEGDTVYAVFTLDSQVYVEDVAGRRLYPIEPASFELTIGSVGPIALVNPQPGESTSYFVVANDLQSGDGFNLVNVPDSPMILPAIDIPAQIDPFYSFTWMMTYSDDTLGSCEILDAVGTYTRDNLLSEGTAISDNWWWAIQINFGHMVITNEGVATETLSWGAVKALFE
jgi:hypothetical protein